MRNPILKRIDDIDTFVDQQWAELELLRKEILPDLRSEINTLEQERDELKDENETLKDEVKEFEDQVWALEDELKAFKEK